MGKYEDMKVDNLKDFEIAPRLKIMTKKIYNIFKFALIMYYIMSLICFIYVLFSNDLNFGEFLGGMICVSVISLTFYLINMVIYTKYLKDLSYIKMVEDLDIIKQKIHAEETFKCENCGNVVYEGTTECSKCGLPFEE